MARTIRRWFLTIELLIILSTVYMLAAVDLLIMSIGFDGETGYARLCDGPPAWR